MRHLMGDFVREVAGESAQHCECAGEHLTAHYEYAERVGLLAQKAVEHLRELIEKANTSGLVQRFSLKHDFPTEWHHFVTGDKNFEATVKKEYFPYFVQGADITISKVELYAVEENELPPPAMPKGVIAVHLSPFWPVSPALRNMKVRVTSGSHDRPLALPVA